MPITLDTTVTTEEGVTLVAAHVRNTEPVDRHVRLENRLDGPVLPPRSNGRPERGWSERGYVGVVAAESVLSIGYACNVASPSSEDPAVELVSVSDPTDYDADPVDQALATLGDARPPADAVPVAERGVAAESTSAHEGDHPRPADATGPASASDSAIDPATTLPPSVVRYLDEVDARLDQADTLASGTVREATETLDAGVDPAGLDRLLAADAAALSRLADRVTALAERADTTTVPTESLERLA